MKAFPPSGPALRTAAAAMLLAGALGCSKKPKNPQSDCGPRFQKLHAKFEKGKYSSAKEGYAEFIVSCSGTEFTEQAFFELAEAQFALKDWMAAEQEYASFLREFAGSRRYEERARYRLALSMAKQVEIPQRDQSKTVESLREFETFLADFSDSPRVDSAKTEMDRLRRLLAERDQMIARLYRRMDEPLAAIVYYKHLLKEYGDRVPAREISLQLAECYIELRQFLEAESQLAQFDGVAKDDPFRERVRDLHRKLEEARARHAREKRKEKEAEQKPRAL
jgi:outer membrane assembly lipoprotein YfiO